LKIHIHPDDFFKITTALEVSFKAKQQLWNQEYRFKRSNGDFAFIIDRGFISYNREGKPIRMIGAFTDISERKQFIEDIERSLALSKATLESTTDGILVVNADEKIVDYNKKFVEMWNIPDSILQTKDDKQIMIFILAQLKNSDKFVAKIKELYASPESESFDVVEFIDGRVFERYSKPQKTKANIVGRVWSFRDITEHRRQQEAEKIKTSQMLFRQQELLKLNSFNIDQSHTERFNKILVSDAKVLGVERLSICFFNESRTMLSSTTTYSLSKNIFLPGMTFQKNDYPRFFQELNNNRIVDANDAIEDPRTAELAKNYLKPLGIVSLMSIPIRSSEKVIGIILHEQITQKRIWSYEDQAFAYSVADIIMLAVENEDKVKIMNTLIESEQLFKIAVSQLPLLFAVFDNNLRWTMAGGKILDSLGLKTQTLIGKTLFQTGDTIDINVSNHKAALEGKSSNYEYKLGETVLQRFVEPLKDTTGKIVGVISMSLDITDRKKAELEIKNLNNRLEQCLKDNATKLPESKDQSDKI
jgi:PAS domain S-box-containing protein